TQDPVFLFKTSYAPRVKGNEHGVGDGPGTSGIDERGNGGLKTEIHNGVVWVDEKAVDVFVNGIQVVRHLDHCFMNVKPPT
ncbi:MAG TPA: hypothetical protein VHB21_10200, partial [Minicystis sp.]|nr:hypothetical protein [Minicystis sp.]